MAQKINANQFRSSAKKQKLIPHLDKAIGEGDFAWTAKFVPKEDDSALHPSGDCTPGLLALYLKALDELAEKPIGPALRKTFMVGHFWHAYVQHLLVHKLEFAEPSAIERKEERVWSWENDTRTIPTPFHWVTGSGDVAPVEIPGHGEYLLDIKTMNYNDFNKGGLPEWTGDKWECQVNIYMDFFDLDRALILGVQKEHPHEFKEFEFARNQPLIDTLYKKWKLVGQCIREELEPPQDHVIELPLQGVVR
jgi:hypothetical protein